MTHTTTERPGTENCLNCGKANNKPAWRKQIYCCHKCSTEHKKLQEKQPGKILTKVGYHERVYQARGMAATCEHCHTTTAKRYEWANISGNYADVNDYISLCPLCHFKFDKRIDVTTKWRALGVIKTCLVCKKKYKPYGAAQKYCGKATGKDKHGCAYKVFNDYQRERERQKRLRSQEDTKKQDNNN